jgi:hypothetical protein
MVSAIFEADDSSEEPIVLTEEESGTLYLVLKTAIDVLHDALERAK